MMNSTNKGVVLAFTAYLLQFPILLGNIYGWLPIHPIVIIPPVLGLINLKIENRGLEGLGLILPHPIRSLVLALILIVIKTLSYIHIFTLIDIAFSFPGLTIGVLFELAKELIIAVFIIAMWEEFASRGFIQTRLQAAWGFLGVIVSALMFASLHLPSAIIQFNYDPAMVLLNFLEMAVSGFMLSLVYWKTRSTLTTIAVHGTRNFLFTLAISYSGLTAPELHHLHPMLQILWGVMEIITVIILMRILFPDEYPSPEIASDR